MLAPVSAAAAITSSQSRSWRGTAASSPAATPAKLKYRQAPSE
jgi:hypothetical protein